MTTLAADMTATQGYIPQTDVSPGFYTLGSELIRVSSERTADRSERGGGQFDSVGLVVSRGIAGTSAAAHSAGVTFVSIQDPSTGGGSGGVTVDNGSDPPAAVTTLVAAGADVSTPGQATLATVQVYSSVADPGAVGARNLWVQLDDTETATFIQLWVRDNDDTGWSPVGWADWFGGRAGIFEGNVYDVDGNALVTLRMSPGDAALIQNGDPVGANFWQGRVEITENGISLAFLDHNGVNVEMAIGVAGFVINGLPTSDPGVGHKLWNDSGTVKITAAS